MTILPVPGSPSDQWILNDYRQVPASSGAAGAAGTCQVTFGPVPDNELWFLERLTVSCTSTTVSTCGVYLDLADPAHLLDWTPTGNSDIADEAAPIQVPSGSALLVVWANASVGAVGSARAQFTIMRRPASV